MNRKEQVIQRKRQILIISLEQFIKKGYYGTSTREIAQIAGISSGLMFHYFDSKENLYHSLVEIGTEKMMFDMKKAGENPKLYLKTVVEMILEQLQSNDFFAKMFVFIDDAQHTLGIPEESEKLLQEVDLYHQCISIIENGQEKGMFKNGNAHALCVAFFGAIQGIAQERVRVQNTPMPEAEWLMDIICN
ncbi:MAG: TetR/AcrR family transcriptional regulator [Velocimicrobium sp.]